MNLLIYILFAFKVALPAGSEHGGTFNVYKNGKLWRVESSVWFNTREDWEMFVYRECRDKGMSKNGALLALAHARIAGGHWKNAKNKKGQTRGPLLGFNLWGITAGKKYKASGKPYHYGFHSDDKGKTWRHYTSPSHGVGGWLFVAQLYPDAKAQFYKKDPSVVAYVEGLCHGEDGRKYMACKGAPGPLEPAYKKSWVSRLENTMSMAKKSLEGKGFVF